ncbi:MAG: succinate dehydrogenase cytochrome b subunit [Bacteroidales bacterium]|nr:succinate dehydrogenase cytochrome b subunit [Bacteroidales bacterium]MDY5562244.1 succinate dehydrogenase cytochrome b subunit [Sodaliphilus sp.]MDY5965429.1 succinate dehydrogenase cytochrome b subunit [Sodaliphilus sp.]
MWLTNSSVGRKVVMSITGLFLVLFVTFHALMNAVAVLSFGAYDKICEFLGANWYAVLGTAVIAGGMVVHIIYAFWLTYQNRKARGGDRYAISKNWKSVSWASQNMLVLGVIVFCFLILHLVQFWAKMQVPELLGEHVMNGKYYLNAVFSQVWVLPVYLIGFAAIWFHLTHGFWSAFQTLGVANDKWICRWRAIACVWATVVFVLFAVEACYFTWYFAC